MIPQLYKRPTDNRRSLTRTLRSLISFILFLIATTGCVSSRTTSDPRVDIRVSWTSQEGYEYLLVAQDFAFGGIGIAGQTSTGEYAFHAVLRSLGAAEVFKLMLSPGAHATEEGKLYALCGIRATDPAEFNQYAATVASTDAKVNTESGCMIDEEKVAEVVKRIANGGYDFHLKQRRLGQPVSLL